MFVARERAPTGATTISRAMIEDEDRDGEVLWDRVDAALKEGKQVWLRSPLLRRLTAALGRDYDGRRWLVLKPPNVEAGLRARWFLRGRDLALSGLVLVALSLPLALVAISVKVSSPGPVF